MTSDIRKHLGHYTVLAGIVMAGLVLISLFRASMVLQQVVVVATSLGYVVWGIAHHQAIGDLSRKIVMEYLMIATLVIVLLNAVLMQR